MKKIVQIILVLIFMLSFSVSLSYAEKTDVVKYRVAFSVMNKIPCYLTLSQSYELYALATAAVEDVEIISIKTKMQTTLKLRLTLKEVYKIRNILAIASDTPIVLELRTKITDIISEFKLKLANFKLETVKNIDVVTKIEGIVLTEEK